MCEPVATGGAAGSAPSQRPKTLPTASTRTARPASSHPGGQPGPGAHVGVGEQHPRDRRVRACRRSAPAPRSRADRRSASMGRRSRQRRPGSSPCRSGSSPGPCRRRSTTAGRRAPSRSRRRRRRGTTRRRGGRPACPRAPAGRAPSRGSRRTAGPRPGRRSSGSRARSSAGSSGSSGVTRRAGRRASAAARSRVPSSTTRRPARRAGGRDVGLVDDADARGGRRGEGLVRVGRHVGVAPGAEGVRDAVDRQGEGALEDVDGAAGAVRRRARDPAGLHPHQRHREARAHRRGRSGARAPSRSIRAPGPGHGSPARSRRGRGGRRCGRAARSPCPRLRGATTRREHVLSPRHLGPGGGS